MHRLLAPLPLVTVMACSSNPTPSSPTPSSPTPSSELAAVLAGVVGSHDRVLAHELETRASRSPDLRALSAGAPAPAVDADIARFLPDCVAIEKSFDPESQSFRFDADSSGCTDLGGRVSAEQVVELDDEPLRLTETHTLSFDDDRTPTLTLSGEAERIRTVNQENLGSREMTAALQVDLTVAVAEDDGAVVDWPMALDHTIALKPDATGIDVTANGTVQLESGLRTFSLQGFWAPEACEGGGWSEGTLRLEHDGQAHELELDCSASTAPRPGYAPAAVDALVQDLLPCEDCAFEGLDLQHTLYVGRDFNEAVFTDVHLGGAILFGSDLSDTELERVDLTDTDFTEVDLDDAYLADCTFERTRFVSTDFNDAALPGADLRTAVLDRISFEDVTLHGGNLAGLDLSLVELEESNLSEVDFTGATLTDRYCEDTRFTDANFTDADLTGSVLHEASLSGAVWSNTTCADGSNSDDNPGGTCDGYW